MKRIAIVVVLAAGRLLAEDARLPDHALARFADPLPRLTLGSKDFAMAPGGKLVASGGYNSGQLCLVDTEACFLDVAKGWGPAMAFSTDGSLLAAGTRGGYVAVYSTSPFTETRRFKLAQYDPVLGVAFSPDGKVLAVSVAKQPLHLLDAATGKPLVETLLTPCEPGQVAFSADGRFLAASVGGVKDGTPSIAVLDTKTWKIRALVPGAAKAIALSPDGAVLAARDEAGVTLFDGATGDKRDAFGDPATQFRTKMSFSADGKRLVQADYSTVVVREIPSGKELHRIETWGTHADTDGSTFAFVNASNCIRVVDVTGAPKLRRRRAHDSAVEELAFSADGKTLASRAFDGDAILWDLQARKFLSRDLGAWDGPSLRPGGTSPDGKLSVAWTAAEGARGVDVLDGEGKILRTIPFAFADGLFASAFSPDSRRVALSLWKEGNPCGVGAGEPSKEETDGFERIRRIPVIEVATGKVLFEISGHDSMPHAIAWSPDGRRIASGASDDTLRVWNAATGEAERGLPVGSDGYLSRVVFAADGRLAVAAGNVVRVFDPATGELLFDLQGGHKDDIQSLAFSPDGKICASGGRDNAVVLWDVGPK